MFYDDYVFEPSSRRRKYRVYRKERLKKHWTLLLSVSRLDDLSETEASPQTPNASPLAGPGPGGHKPSFKSSNKLARRARSFKDDFLGKISQIRSPVSSGASTTRAQSPKSHAKPTAMVAEKYMDGKRPIQELEGWKKETAVALKHFRDVVAKNKLEMLPGNGTIILETIWAINLSIRSSVKNDKSSSISSATHRVYQAVARLIKLCDDALLDDQSSELKNENVNEIVQQVDDAVKSLIELAQEKIERQQLTSYKTTPRSSLSSTTLESQSQRNSLPDIPLTPREREILAQTSSIPHSHSTESILRDPDSPPPKPPLPPHMRNRSDSSSCVTPPPLPPKKKNQQRYNNLIDHDCSSLDNSAICNSLERVSLRSKSPEDSISLRSEETGSIDSMLNNSSKEEEEIRALMDGEDNFMENRPNSWEESSVSSNNHLDLLTLADGYHRRSKTDSGIMSIKSSSYSKRSSQQSSVSAQYYTSRPSNEHLDNTTSTVQIKSFSQKSSSSTLVVSNSSHSIITRFPEGGYESEDLPPAIPEKTKRKTENRQPSPYDNVPELDHSMGDNVQTEVLVSCHQHQSHQHSYHSSIISNNSSILSNTDETDNAKPPPLPPKKKHIMAYMEMFGNCSHSNDPEFMRHSVHMVQSQWGTPSMIGMSSTQSFHSAMHTSNSRSHTLSLPPHSNLDRGPSPLHSPNTTSSSSSTSSVIPPALPPKQKNRKSKSPPPTPSPNIYLQEPKSVSLTPSPNQLKSLPDLLEHTASKGSEEHVETPEATLLKSSPIEEDLMEKINVDDYLVLKKPEEEGPELRGGTLDALIIQATKATKNGVFAYQEAFQTTYRTFISPLDLITKLIRRYNHFYYQKDTKPVSRGAFSLIVRVVSDLTSLDLDVTLTIKLMNFVQHLISCGELVLAKSLRVKLLERHAAKQQSIRYSYISSLTLSARNATLIDFKSEHIAEQMTLLDAELFMKIEIPEVLIWAQEQSEERSPNLTRFTEHFNKMSYWTRTKILTAETKELREKYFVKFIKIMKHLRKINNFNSYLALLSALDSAPIERLEWQKHVQEGLKEYCALIDSSGSFRAYRNALAEAQPPCIPYIGIVLQDLTFVHIGNPNLLANNFINFGKRWQQFSILENMKKFKMETYDFKKNERIIQFFQNFDDYIGEDAMWKLSEKIKPRGGKKAY
ncbi:guanine nucleotide-releasing factor 2 isoform X2 [Anthonomus grandis grandis]|uniref:guanine nucleotide-releasing factor 2 isoform X2 n=1 Tax=Anthonomus grandis grandis TaxID=2921223 RepID=UPI0021657E6C|nr:guanine nucleotide-releasing factor 2 isoform X2 [Anthonomus grandis grandis]